MAEEKQEAAKSDHLEALNKTVGALKEEIKTATAEMLKTKEALLKANEAMATSKGNLTDSVKEASPYTYVEAMQPKTRYKENTFVIEGKGTGKASIMPARPEAWY